MEEIPEDIAVTLLRALVFCGGQVTEEQANNAWDWVDSRRGNVEEMGN